MLSGPYQTGIQFTVISMLKASVRLCIGSGAEAKCTCVIEDPLVPACGSLPVLCLLVSLSQAAAPQYTPPWLITAASFSPLSACFTPLTLYASGVTCARGNRCAHPLSALTSSHGCSHWRWVCLVQTSPCISLSRTENEPSVVQAEWGPCGDAAESRGELAAAACLGAACAQIKPWRALH